MMSVLRDSGERENRNRGVERVAHPTSAQKKKTSESPLSTMGDDGDLTVELTVEPEVGMELCLEKLKMLRYERDFLASRRPPWPPCTRTHFALPPPPTGQNANELFHHFTSLCSHLLQLCGARFKNPDQFDDPNATCAAIFAELKQCGFQTPSFAPGKLRQGHGRECVGVLNGLCDLAMRRNFTHGLSRPVYPRGEGGTHGGVEGGGADQSFDADLAMRDPSSQLVGGGEGGLNDDDLDSDGLNANHSSDEEEEEYAVASALDRDAPLDASLKKVLRRTEEEIEERRAIESAVDAREWKLELERGTFIFGYFWLFLVIFVRAI